MTTVYPSHGPLALRGVSEATDSGGCGATATDSSGRADCASNDSRGLCAHPGRGMRHGYRCGGVGHIVAARFKGWVNLSHRWRRPGGAADWGHGGARFDHGDRTGATACGRSWSPRRQHRNSRVTAGDATPRRLHVSPGQRCAKKSGSIVASGPGGSVKRVRLKALQRA